MFLRNTMFRLSTSTFVGALVLVYGCTSFAAPSITNIVNKDDGTTYQINGSGFGNKAIATPFKWDDFEAGVAGQLVTTKGWLNYSGGSVGPVFSTANPRTGKQSALRETDTTRDDFNSAGLKGINSNEVYISVWFYWKKVSGTYSQGQPIVKILRVNSAPNFYTGTPSFWLTQMPSANWTYGGVVTADGTDQQDAAVNLSENAWHRIELSFKLSTPEGSANGYTKLWIDGVLSYNKTGVTRTTAEAGKLLDNFLLPAMIDRGGQVMNYFADDVYVDTTQSRIEICSASTWVACKDRDVQVASAWSDTSITVTARKDAFKGAQALYAYVVDASGNANANGFLIPTQAAPAPPSGVVVSPM